MDFLTLKERIQGDVEGGQVGEHLHVGVVGVELGGRGAVQVSRSDAVVPDAVVPDAVISGAVNSDALWLVWRRVCLAQGLSGAGAGYLLVFSFPALLVTCFSSLSSSGT